MKKIIGFLIGMFLLLVVSSMILEGPGKSHTAASTSGPGDLLTVTLDLGSALGQALSLVFDFTVKILVTVWEAAPPGLKFLIGLLLILDRLLVLLGIAALRGWMGFWSRHID
jgi:hypothetical protein